MIAIMTFVMGVLAYAPQQRSEDYICSIDVNQRVDSSDDRFISAVFVTDGFGFGYLTSDRCPESVISLIVSKSASEQFNPVRRLVRENMSVARSTSVRLDFYGHLEQGPDGGRVRLTHLQSYQEE